MPIGVILIIVFVLIMGGMVVAALYVYKQTDTTKNPEIKYTDSDDTKSFLLYKSLEEYAMDLGKHQYRAIIEVSSLNYGLMTEYEQDVVDAAYERFLNSLTTEICIHVQTKVIDNSEVIKHLDRDIELSVAKFPSLANYASIYKESLENLSSYINITKQKKKYVIVSFSDAGNLEKLSDEEKKEFLLGELYAKAQSMCNGLEAVGLKTKILNRNEIAAVLYSAYNRKIKNLAYDIVEGAYSQLVVTSPNPSQKFAVKDIMSQLIEECNNKIDGELDKHKEISIEELMLFKKIRVILEKSVDVLQEREDNNAPVIDNLDEIMELFSQFDDIEVDAEDKDIANANIEIDLEAQRQLQLNKDEEDGFVFYGRTT